MRLEDLKAFTFLGVFFGFVALIALVGWVAWFLISTHRIQTPHMDRHAATIGPSSVAATNRQGAATTTSAASDGKRTPPADGRRPASYT
jgi:hypothetical protein